LKRHQTNDNPELVLNQEFLKTKFNEFQAVDLEIQVGQVSLHDVYLVHGSEPNRSTQSRRGMTLRFVPTASKYDREIVNQQ